jgi:hypothetical protein
MSAEPRFAREEIAEIPSPLFGRPDLPRTVRVFVKGPTGGVNSETRILVNLHGLGGRQNDISYKMFRRVISDELNTVVVGVNFLGTASYVHDQGFIDRTVRPQVVMLLAHERSKFQAIGANMTVTLGPPRFFFIPNADAARVLSEADPTDYWDFGYGQALDVLRALHWLVEQLRLSYGIERPPPIDVVSQSAGSQVAIMALKLAPRTFASVLDIGGYFIVGGSEPLLVELLSNQFGHSDHAAHASFIYPGMPKMALVRRVPVPFADGLTRRESTLADEVSIRVVTDHAAWITRTQLSGRFLSIGGAADLRMTNEGRDTFLGHLRKAGVDAELEVIGKDRVDGSIFSATEHEITRAPERVYRQYAAKLRKTSVTSVSDLGSDSVYEFPTATGSWSMSFRPTPTIDFQARQRA